MDVEDDDLFDHDLEDVPTNTLENLERRATLSQRPRTGGNGSRQLPVKTYSYDTRTAPDSETLDADVIVDLASSDYGFDDEDVIDLDDPTATFGQHDAPYPVGAKSGAQGGSSTRHNYHSHSYQSHPAEPSDDTLAQAHQASSDLELLQARVAELEQERTRLNKELDDAKIDATTKAGAIANLRSRNDRTTKDFEAKLATLRKEQADERAKLKSDIQSAKNDQEKIKTSNKFLEHDLAQETERAKRLRGAVNGTTRASMPPAGQSVTPKKTKKHGFADGFDDHEIIAISPTRRLDKDRAGTPKAGNKRKRVAPGVSPAGSPMQVDSPGLPGSADDELEAEAAALSKLIIKDERLETYQKVLTHRSSTGRKTLEILADYQVPGDNQALGHDRGPTEDQIPSNYQVRGNDSGSSLASYLLESLAAIPIDDILPVSVVVRRICLDIWDLCLHQKQWAPLSIVLDLFASMLDLESGSIQVQLFERLVSLAVKSSVIVAEPRNQSGSLTRQAPKASQQAKEHINDIQILGILYRVATSASLNADHAGAFWQRMEFAFTILMLNRGQPLPQIHLMLRMITSSILDDSFGARHVDAECQAKQESDLLDRLSGLLFDTPAVPTEHKAPSLETVQDLRMAALRTLRAVSGTQHGSTAMAQHRFVVGRLVRFLSDQTTSLYTTPPLPVPVIDTSEEGPTVRLPIAGQTLHEKIIATINLSTRILYHLLHDHEIVLSEKFAPVANSDHKFFIGLSRIAFSERLLLEAGLEDVVVDAAHEILDKTLTPEEGEAILLAMETPSSARSVRQSLSGVSAPE
ncbi:Hypothetical protein D9617_18g033950 [Elsinoe fawcettii]|nr:Hypothetical protein D9617_18g033950 [Elsinoe fawcettii]